MILINSKKIMKINIRLFSDIICYIIIITQIVICILGIKYYFLVNMVFFFLPVDRAFFDVSRGTYYAIFIVILYTSFLYIIVILLIEICYYK